MPRRAGWAQAPTALANICWWYAMGARVDWTVTPRPVYHADGRKSPDCYTDPPGLHGELTAALGTFPLLRYWGPGAGLASSEWICGAAQHVMARHDPDLTLVYVPHLDYDLQRHGPGALAAATAAASLDAVLGPLLDAAASRGATVVALSEYGPQETGHAYLMNVIGPDAGAAAVRGSHGRLPASRQDGPVLLCSSPQAARDRYEATEVKDLLLHLAGLTAQAVTRPPVR